MTYTITTISGESYTFESTEWTMMKSSGTDLIGTDCLMFAHVKKKKFTAIEGAREVPHYEDIPLDKQKEVFIPIRNIECYTKIK